MLLRELIKECISRLRSTSPHILMALANAGNGIFVVLAIRLQVLSKDVVEGVSSALAAPSGKLLQLHQALATHRQGVHAG
jgi:hypothetical protein